MLPFKKEDLNENIKGNSNSILDQVYEKNMSFSSKLDFNFEHMNKYLSKCMFNYLWSIYRLNPDIAKRYITSNFNKMLVEKIEKEKRLYNYTNDIIEILNAEMIDQVIESVNYISKVVIRIKVKSLYYRENIFTSSIKEIREIYSIDIEFKYTDNGWLINNVFNQNYEMFYDDKVIKY